MRALLLAVGVLGLALVFHLSEPAPASTQPVTSDDVQLLSEQMASHGVHGGANKSARKNLGGRGRFGVR
jgi:hypothetical protein